MSNVQVACNGLSVFLNDYFLDPGPAVFFFWRFLNACDL